MSETVTLLDGSVVPLERDYGYQAHRVALAHLGACNDESEDTPAVGPYCGCEDCDVREILSAAFPVLKAGILREQTE